MKHSKVFLGITTLALATVGVMAAKAHRALSKSYSIFTSTGIPNCQHIGNVTGTVTNETGSNKTIKTSTHLHVAYLTKSGSSCVDRLYTNAN